MFAIVVFVLALTVYVVAWPFIAGAMQERRTLENNKKLRDANETLRMEKQKLQNQLQEAIRQAKFGQRG